MSDPLITQPAKVEDFSGGITDNFIAGPSSSFEKADNFFINDNAKLSSRPGSVLFDSANPQVPAGQNRVGSLFSLQDQLFQQSVADLYYILGASFNILTGPTGNSIYPGSDKSNYVSNAEWNNHQIIGTDKLTSIKKVYKDDTDTFRVTNNGLPGVTQAGAIELANELKEKYNDHLADTSQHTASADSDNRVIAPDAYNLDSLFTLTEALIIGYDAHDADAELSSGHVYHAGQENADHSLTTTVVPVTLTEVISRLEDLQAKFNAHDADSGAHGATSLYQSSETTTPTVTPTVNNGKGYVYAFVYQYEYKIGSVTFVERGPTVLVEVPDGDEPSVNQHDIANIPELVNGFVESWDVTNINVEIYRTIADGQTLYLIGTVDNGTATFTDTVSDSIAQDGLIIYTEGDVLDNDPPPPAKYVLSINDIIWYGGIKEGNVERPTRIRHSNKSQPGSCPEAHFEDLDDEITGIGAVNIFPIYFCQNKTYRIEGFYDTTGRGFIKKREISNTVGCVSHRSIVSVKNRLYFAGDDGFYVTDGFQVDRISEDFNETYKTLVETQDQRDRIYGTYDELNDRVLWSVKQDSGAADNDVIYVAHLRYQRRSQEGGVKVPFTTWSGGNLPANFSPTSLFVTDDNQLLRGDTRGYLFRHDEDELDDPLIVVADTPANWEVTPIVYEYRSVATDFGLNDIRKWVPKMLVTMDNISNVSLNISSMNDNSGAFAELKPIRYRENIEWGDQLIEWNTTESDEIKWNFFPVISQRRRFPAGGLRCSYKQIKFTNDDTIISASDEIGVATIDDAAKTITLDTFPTNTWEPALVNYYISFEDDGYANKFLILERADEVLTVFDPSDLLTTASAQKWQISGIKKSEKINIFSYVVMFAPLTMTQDTFKGETGENA